MFSPTIVTQNVDGLIHWFCFIDYAYAHIESNVLMLTAIDVIISLYCTVIFSTDL